jgi:peptide/nickel transport system ATP-binding protein
VRYLATRIAVMYRGKIVEIGETEQITERPTHAYTKTLLAATPEVVA